MLTVFTLYSRAKLYRFGVRMIHLNDENPERVWLERGVGEMKILKCTFPPPPYLNPQYFQKIIGLDLQTHKHTGTKNTGKLVC
jgi:hypothetical protein